jgi:glycosyltransferase involved in cell wall biosynthesis
MEGEMDQDLHCKNIGVVIVTYDNRSRFLSNVLARVFEQTKVAHIKYVIVCDNGSTQETKNLLQNLANNNPKLRIVSLPENTGSANGYAVAIKEAIKYGCEWIWCLDDDNLPELDALEQLIRAKMLVEPNAALLSLRENDPSYIKRACGWPLHKAFGPPYSFLGFSVFELLQKIKSRLLPSSTQKRLHLGYREEPVEVPYAPYGGFF